MSRGLFEHYGYRVVHQLLMTNALGILAFEPPGLMEAPTFERMEL
jgi:hypothetical protein